MQLTFLYKFSWILTLAEVISIRILHMRIISTIINFYWSHAIALQTLSNERSYKFSWIFALTEVITISIRILCMLIISAIMNFYWSHDIALQKLSNKRSYKSTLREEILAGRKFGGFFLAQNRQIKFPPNLKINLPN